MSLYHISELTEVTALNFDKDFIEMSHATAPTTGNYVSYKVPVSRITDSLKSDIAAAFSMQTELSIVQPQVGKLFYHSACPSTLAGLSSQLLSGDWIPLASIEGKQLHVVSSDLCQLSSSSTALSVLRPDLSSFLLYAAEDQSGIFTISGHAVIVNADKFSERYVLNSISSLGSLIPSSAPTLSGTFPTGNKILGIEVPEYMLSGCMSLAPNTVQIYSSDQDFTLRTGIKYTVDASRCSDVYGRIEDLSAITPPTVQYAMCMFVKDYEITVKVQTA